MTEPRLLLNIAPISFSKESILIGHLPKVEGEQYQRLRENHWETHAFRFDNRTNDIVNVSLNPNVAPLGSKENANIHEHLLIVARAIQHSILLWLANKRKILSSKKALVFWGQAEDALFLSTAAKKANASRIEGLEVALRYKIDCRMLSQRAGGAYLGLIVDLATSNIINIPVSELLLRRFSLVGRYVCQFEDQGEDYLEPRPKLLGRVTGLDKGRLLLTDTEGINSIEASEVFLEPRLENLNDVVQLFYGSKAKAILETLSNLRSSISSAPGKAGLIQQTFNRLRARREPIIIGDNVEIAIGDLLTSQSLKFLEEIKTERPTLLFGPQGRNTHTTPDRGLTEYGPYMYMQHHRNAPLLAIICESRYRGRVEQFVQSLIDGYPDTHWKHPKRDNPYRQGLIGKFRLNAPTLEIEEVRELTAQGYREAINRLLTRLSSTPDLALVQIRESFSTLHGNQNPYLISKAALMMAGVPSQSIRIEKIDTPGDGLAYLLNNVALAMYAKLDGIPWVMSTRLPTTHEIVIGLGATESRKERLGTRTRYVGITSVFQGDGRYLVWGATREVEFAEYPQALLETLRSVVRHVSQQNVWEKGDRVRLVCHVYKRLRDCEVEAVKSLVSELLGEYEVEYAFLDISWWHPYHIFALRNSGVPYYDYVNREERIKGRGVPLRGLALLLDKSRGLLQLTGPREVKTDYQGIPKPLLVELHRDSDFTDMTYLLRQVYHFSYMSWRSFTPSPEPVTIIYSELIARLLGNLRPIDGWNSSGITFGSLRDRRWFL